jgi:cell wall-associated NlpC family hydrolase
MVWDATAYAYTIHALGAVEASMDYGATNPSDVISVGLLQWYAQRAANVLDEMKSTNPSDWTPMASSTLDSDLTAHSATDSFWNNRYLYADERNLLHSVMATTANKAVQDAQAQTDIDNDYIPAGAAIGIDKDATPETMAFFINIFNRNPTAARRIISNCGPDSSLDRIYSYTINDQTENAYKSRYLEAKTIIAAHDTTGVGIGSITPPPSTNPGGNTGGGNVRPSGNALYIQQRGNDLILFNKDNTKLQFHHSGPDIWISHFDENVGVPPVVPPPPVGGPTPTAITDIIAWETSVIGTYTYCDGCGGRLNPPVSGLSDCSGLQYYAYKHYAGIYIGTWTGEQIGYGHLITKDPTVAKDGTTVIPGDLIFYRWSKDSPSTYDHVELYAGGGQNLSHGGPGKGPHLFSSNSEIDAAISGSYGDGTGPGSIEVRRYI